MKMDEKLRKLSDMGKKIKCTSCGYEWRPDLLKDKRCPNCQKILVKEIEMELERC
jgi:predicted Zn-ribbon and HTH transcriptional regulator